MPRKPAPEHADDIGVELAPPVTPAQLTELHALGYRGPSPSTSDQAAYLLRQCAAPELSVGDSSTFSLSADG